VGLRAGLDREARGKILLTLPGIEPRLPGRPFHSQTLHWLNYPGSIIPLHALQKLEPSCVEQMHKHVLLYVISNGSACITNGFPQ
jgi:hypothetical protein